MLLSLTCFHDSNNNCINDVLPLHTYLLVICLLSGLVLLILLLLLLMSLWGCVCDFDVGVLEILGHRDLLAILECGGLHVLFVKDLLLGVAEPHEGGLDLTVGDACHLLDLEISQLRVLVEEQEDD